MKIYNYILSLVGITSLFAGCQKLEMAKVPAPDSDKIIAPVMAKLPTSIAMSGENLNTEVTFKWDNADFGYSTQINYSIEASASVDGPKAVLFSGIADSTYSTTYMALNQVLINPVEKGGLALVPGVPSKVNFYIGATIGSTFEKFYSNAIPVNITCTDSDPVYPEIYVIGDYCGWNHENALNLYDYAETDITYTGLVDFMWKSNKGFKITGIKGWQDDCNWGIDNSAEAPKAEASSIKLISAGNSGNIEAYSKRFYQFSFTKKSGLLKNLRSFDYIGVIGDFNGWGGDALMYYDNEKQVFFADVEIAAAGGLKFRLDKDWAVSFGTSQKDVELIEGTLDGGENIKVPAGNYRIYVNMNNPDEMTFKLSAKDYKATDPGAQPEKPAPEEPMADVWGLVGSITNWADNKDINLVAEGDWLVAKNITLTTKDEFKFRTNGKWGNERTVAEGTVVAINQEYQAVKGSNNIKVATGGTFDIYLASTLDKFYVMTTGQVPAK